MTTMTNVCIQNEVGDEPTYIECLDEEYNYEEEDEEEDEQIDNDIHKIIFDSSIDINKRKKLHYDIQQIKRQKNIDICISIQTILLNFKEDEEEDKKDKFKQVKYEDQPFYKKKVEELKNVECGCNKDGGRKKCLGDFNCKKCGVCMNWKGYEEGTTLCGINICDKD